MTATPYLGRVVNHDPRSLDYPARTAPALTRVFWPRYGPTLDQGETPGACTAHALYHALNSRPLHKYREHLYTHDEAVTLYAEATKLDPFPGSWPPDDTGSSGLAAAKAAKNRGLITGYSWAFGVDQVLGALMLSPVMLGTMWFGDMFEPDRAGRVSLSGGEAGGHEYLAVGYDPATRTVTCQNSWGPTWGRYGRFTLTVDQLDTLLRARGDATVITRA